jgi:hypothetical protein
MRIVYFEASAHLLYLRPFKIIRGCLLIQGKITKLTRQNGGICYCDIEMMIVAGSHKVFVSVYFVSQGQIIPPSTVIVGQVREMYM